MAIVKNGEYGLYISGKIEINLIYNLEDEEEFKNLKKGDIIDDKEALKLLKEVREDLASSNDGSEEIANAKIILI